MLKFIGYIVCLIPFGMAIFAIMGLFIRYVSKDKKEVNIRIEGERIITHTHRHSKHW